MSILIRIEEADCGCRFDKKTNLVTAFCEKYDPEEIEKRIKYLEERVDWLENLIYDRTRG